MPQYSTQIVTQYDVFVDVEQVEENLHVYRKTTTTKRVSSMGDMKAKVGLTKPLLEEAVVDDAALARLLKGGSPKARPLWIVPLELQERLRCEGYAAIQQELWNCAKTSVYDALVVDKVSIDTLVELDTSAHRVRDRNGKALPMGLNYDYINSRISESRYDLARLADYLVTKDNFVIREIGARRRGPPIKDAKKAISSIPYYNAERGRRQTIEFVWQPTAEEFDLAYSTWMARKPAYDTNSGLMEVIAELDLLGINQFRRDPPIETDTESDDYDD